MKAMVLAAGVGSRLDPLTTQVPKPLVPVGNVPVMDHIIRLLSKHGFTDIIANLHYMPDQISSHYGDGKKYGVNLSFRLEKELSGDAGGVRACRDFLGSETFIVLMGDLMTDADLSAIINEHRQKKALATIAVKEVPDVQQFGVVVTNEAGFITGFQEKPRPEEALSNMASCGIYVLEPAVFEHMPATGTYGFGRQLFPELVKKNLPVLASEIKTYWSDVGTIRQYRQTNFDFVNRLIDAPRAGMWEKIGESNRWLYDGAVVSDGAVIKGSIIVGAGSRVNATAELSSVVVIGDGCHIEEGARLDNVVLWNGARVCRDARLKDCVVGPGCVIEAGAQLEDKTVMANAQPISVS